MTDVEIKAVVDTAHTLHLPDAGIDDADAGAIALPARYEIRYRTHAIDLTRTG